MYSITDLKKGTLIELNEVLYRVVDYRHTQLGRGGAVAKTKLKNIKTGGLISQTFKGNEKISPANVRKVDMQYLFSDKGQVTLMNPKNYNQVTFDKSVAGKQINFMPEGADVAALIWKDSVVGLEIPNKVKLKIISTEPAVRGDTTGTALKPATAQTGATLQVPLFVNKGDVITVDTRTGSYEGRA